MKLTMTPKVPQLHNRTLSGNILDQSLGLLQNSVLEGSDVGPDMLDPLHMIGEEVSITQEESEGVVPESPNENVEQISSKTGANEIVQQMSSRIGGDVESDDTPGIGMEVVCIGSLEQDNIQDNIYAEVEQLMDGMHYGLRFPKKQSNNLVNKILVTPESHVPSLSASSTTPRKRGRPRVSS